MTVLDRLSPLDLAFLAAEDADSNTSMAIASAAVVVDRPPHKEEFTAFIRDRLPAIAHRELPARDHPYQGTMMRLDELLQHTAESLDAKMVYTAPYEKDGITVIAAARVAGGGNGQDEHQGQQGEGAGFGLTATPTGAYVLKNGKLRWQPAIDVNRLMTVVGLVAIGALYFSTRMVRIRARTGA